MCFAYRSPKTVYPRSNCHPDRTAGWLARKMDVNGESDVRVPISFRDAAKVGFWLVSESNMTGSTHSVDDKWQLHADRKSNVNQYSHSLRVHDMSQSAWLGWIIDKYQAGPWLPSQTSNSQSFIYITFALQIILVLSLLNRILNRIDPSDLTQKTHTTTIKSLHTVIFPIFNKAILLHTTRFPESGTLLCPSLSNVFRMAHVCHSTHNISITRLAGIFIITRPSHNVPRPTLPLGIQMTREGVDQRSSEASVGDIWPTKWEQDRWELRETILGATGMDMATKIVWVIVIWRLQKWKPLASFKTARTTRVVQALHTVITITATTCAGKERTGLLRLKGLGQARFACWATRRQTLAFF